MKQSPAFSLVWLWLAGALAIGAAAAPDSLAFHCQEAPAAGQAAFDGKALVERYRQLPACRMRIKMRVHVFGNDHEAQGTLLFRRPGHLRAEWDGFGQDVQFVSSPREHRAYYPQEQVYQDLDDYPQNAQVWDAFANPVRSLAALLEPNGADRALIDGGWGARLKSLPAERVEGVLWARFEGRGAGGARVDLWVSPDDRLIRRVTLSHPRSPDEMTSDIRIEVELFDPQSKIQNPKSKIDDAEFRLAIPKQARDANQEFEANHRGGMAEDQHPLRALRQRLGERPRDPAAVQALAQGLVEAGQHVEALRLVLQLMKTAPSPAASELLARTYLQMGANQAAINTLVKAVQHYGSEAKFGEELSALAGAAQSTGRGAELAAALEKALGGKPPTPAQRAILGQLYAAARQNAKAAEQFALLLDPGPGAKAEDLPPFELFVQVMQRLASLAERLDAKDRARLTTAVGRAQVRFPIEAQYMLFPLYLALGDMESAERAIAAMDVLGEGDGVWVARLAEAHALRGNRAAADRLFREALLAAVEAEPMENQLVLQLLQVEAAREFLAPVFRQLAEKERREDPLQAAHWLFFAGDHADAARAYGRYLAAPESAREVASSGDRLTAAALGARAAREAKDTALADRFVVEAVPDLTLMRAELPRGYSSQIYLQLLLAAASPQARTGFFETVAKSHPEALLEWVQYGGYRGRGMMESSWEGPDRDANGEMKALLKRLVASPAVEAADPETMAQLLMGQQLPSEAADVYLRFLRKSPQRVDPELVTSLASSLESPPGDAAEEEGEARSAGRITLQSATEVPSSAGQSRPEIRNPKSEIRNPKSDPRVKELIALLEKAVRARKPWDQGEQSLAQWYVGHDEEAKGLALLTGLARRRGQAEDFAELAQTELGIGKHAQALAHLQIAMRLEPKNDNYRTQYGQALQSAGRNSAALAWWRQLKTSARTAEEITTVASGLRGMGQEAEASAFVEASYPKARLAERYPGEANSLRSEIVERYRSEIRNPKSKIENRKSKIEKVLALYPEAEVFELDVEPEALRHLNVDFPAEVWGALIARLDKAGKGRAAFAAHARALTSGGLGTAGGWAGSGSESGYRSLVERARRLGSLELAREELRWMVKEQEGDDLPRSWLATLEEETGRADAAAALYRKILHPDGAPYPHSTPAAARACRGLAALLEKEGKSDEAARYRKWAEALTLHHKPVPPGPQEDSASKRQASLQRAQELFPESPCIQADLVALASETSEIENRGTRASGSSKIGAPAPAGHPESKVQDPAPLLKALTLMVPVAAGVPDCSHCQPLLNPQSAIGAPASAGHPQSNLPFDDLLKATNEAAGALFLKAVALTTNRRPEGHPRPPAEAAALWRKVVEKDPKQVAAWEALRDLAEQHGNLEQSAEAGRQVAALRGDRSEDWQRLAQTYLRLGRRNEARAAMQKAAELEPTIDLADWGLEGQMLHDGRENELAQLFNHYEYYYSFMSDLEPW